MQYYFIPKPKSLSGYATHRIAAAVAKGALHADSGNFMVVRSDKPIPGAAVREIPRHDVGAVMCFTLRACVGAKVRGKHHYFPVADWRSRAEWLRKKSLQHGFEIITVHVQGNMQRIEKTRSSFWVDDTRFDGALKVVDADKFAEALRGGIGNKGRAFGYGLLIV
jgi:hypothetical protein